MGKRRRNKRIGEDRRPTPSPEAGAASSVSSRRWALSWWLAAGAVLVLGGLSTFRLANATRSHRHRPSPSMFRRRPLSACPTRAMSAARRALAAMRRSTRPGAARTMTSRCRKRTSRRCSGISPRPGPECDAGGAGGCLQGRERAIRIDVGQVAHPLFFDEIALARQQLYDARDDSAE